MVRHRRRARTTRTYKGGCLRCDCGAHDQKTEVVPWQLAVSLCSLVQYRIEGISVVTKVPIDGIRKIYTLKQEQGVCL